MPRPRRRRLIMGLGISVAVLALLVVGLELVLRARGYGALPSVWFDPHVGTRFHASQSREIYGPGMAFLSKARINAQGYRGPDFDDPRYLSERRVLCVGDSFTFGWGVEDDQSYPAVLQAALDEAEGDGAWQVLNAGMPGYNTWQQLQLYSRELGDLEPDVVVVGWYLNDLDPYSIGATGTLASLDHPLAGTAILDWYVRKLRKRAPRFDFEGLDRDELREMKKWYDQNREIVEHNAGDSRSRPYVERNLADLGALFEAIREDGARPVLLLFPSVAQMDSLRRKRDEAPAELDAHRGIVARIQRDLTEFAAARDVPVVDLLPVYIDATVRPYGEVDQSHPSVHGHELAARAVLDALEAGGLLEAGD